MSSSILPRGGRLILDCDGRPETLQLTQEGAMAITVATISKLVASREKSIAKIDAEIAEFASQPGSVFSGLVQVREQRKARLLEELAGFRKVLGDLQAEASRKQPSLKGVVK